MAVSKPTRFGPARNRKTVADWRTLVYRHRGPGLGNGVRVMLIYLADNMRSDLTVSVPRSRIAEDLGVSASEIRTRLRSAVEAGLLDSVQRGRPGVTAVYAATFPDAHGTGNPPSETGDRGNPVMPAKSKHTPTRLEVLPSDLPQSSVIASGATATGETGSFTSADAPAPKKTNNAISEEFARSQDKRDLLDQIQKIAALYAAVPDMSGPVDSWYPALDRAMDAQAELQTMGEEIFGDDVFSHGEDMGWQPTARERDRLAAGVWLNKYLNWYQQEQRPISWSSARQKAG